MWKITHPNIWHIFELAPSLEKNHADSYTQLERSGAGVTTYWIDAQLFAANPELGWLMSDGPLIAEDYDF